MELAEALQQARAHVQRMGLAPEVIVLEAETLARPYGWIFFYADRRHVEGGDVRYALGGNAPFLVDRETGAIHELGTHAPIEKQLREYEARLAGK
jgi:hypothetical protein